MPIVTNGTIKRVAGPTGFVLHNSSSSDEQWEIIKKVFEDDCKRYNLTKSGLNIFSPRELAPGPKKILEMMKNGDSVDSIKTELMDPANKIHPDIKSNIFSQLTDFDLKQKYSQENINNTPAPEAKLNGPRL